MTVTKIPIDSRIVCMGEMTCKEDIFMIDCLQCSRPINVKRVGNKCPTCLQILQCPCIAEKGYS